MDTTTPQHTPPRTSPAAADDAPFPWLALVILGSATFTMVTAEMLPAAVLPQMSEGLGVGEPQIGLLVSIWAAAVVVGSFPLVRFARRWNRRSVIIVALAVLATSAALTAIAPTYPTVIAARMLGALSVGLLWATTNAFTADLVADHHLARAVAVVLGGATLGMVLGIPAGNVVAQAIGWRASFGGLAALALLAAALVAALIRTPALVGDQAHPPAGEDAPATPALAASRKTPLAPLLTVTLLVALLLVGHYGAYTFITRLIETPAAVLPGGIGSMLFLFGLASAAGIALAGRFGARTELALFGSAVITATALLGLATVDTHLVVGFSVVVVWAVASGALPVLAQTVILRLAGTERRGFAGALIPVLFNLGVAVGAAVASGVVGGLGLGGLPVFAAGVVAAAAIGLAITAHQGRSQT